VTIAIANIQSTIDNSQYKEVKDFFAPMPVSAEHTEILAPRKKRHMLDWMESFFILPDKSSRIKGPWSAAITPYWRTVIDWLCDMTTRVIWVYAATQVGKSTIMTGWMGYVIDVDPGPMKLVLPDRKVCKKRIKRIKPIFANSPRVLRHLGGDIRNLNIGEPTDLDNMMLTLGWPTAPGTLADDPCRYVGGDEVCEWEQDIRDDTDPLSKLDNRVRTYETVSKQFYITSPKNAGDLADRNYEDCLRYDVWIPCPECGKFHIANFINVKLDKDSEGGFLKSADYKKGGHARYVCPHCGSLWTELERKAAVSGYRACPAGCTIDDSGKIAGDYTESPRKAIRIPAVLVDPMFTTVDTLAADYANAMRHRKAGNINPYRNFRNNQEAIAWEERERETSITQLRRHISDYPMRRVPAGVQMICGGIDVQADHVWATVKGYGYRNQQWLIWAGRIETGHTGRAGNWDIVENFVRGEWPSMLDEEFKFRLVKTAIDCRYQRPERDEESSAVYDFCLRFGEGYVVPVMGYGRVRMRYASYRAANVAGKALKRFDLNVDMAKDRLWQLLYDKAREPGPGYMHLPADISEDILRQLASESQMLKRQKGGREIVVWVKKEGFRENHTWDTNVYADFAAELAGVFHLQDIDMTVHIKGGKKKKQTGYPGGSDYWDGVPKLHWA